MYDIDTVNIIDVFNNSACVLYCSLFYEHFKKYIINTTLYVEVSLSLIPIDLIALFRSVSGKPPVNYQFDRLWDHWGDEPLNLSRGFILTMFIYV